MFPEAVISWFRAITHVMLCSIRYVLVPMHKIVNMCMRKQKYRKAVWRGKAKTVHPNETVVKNTKHKFSDKKDANKIGLDYQLGKSSSALNETFCKNDLRPLPAFPHGV